MLCDLTLGRLPIKFINDESGFRRQVSPQYAAHGLGRIIAISNRCDRIDKKDNALHFEFIQSSLHGNSHDRGRSEPSLLAFRLML